MSNANLTTTTEEGTTLEDKVPDTDKGEDVIFDSSSLSIPVITGQNERQKKRRYDYNLKRHEYPTLDYLQGS